MLFEFAACVGSFRIFWVACGRLLLTRTDQLSVFRACGLLLLRITRLLLLCWWLLVQLGLVVGIFLDSVLAISYGIAADPSLQLRLLVVADLNIHMLTLLQRVFVRFHEARGRILTLVELLLVLEFVRRGQSVLELADLIVHNVGLGNWRVC